MPSAFPDNVVAMSCTNQMHVPYRCDHVTLLKHLYIPVVNRHLAHNDQQSICYHCRTPGHVYYCRPWLSAFFNGCETWQRYHAPTDSASRGFNDAFNSADLICRDNCTSHRHSMSPIQCRPSHSLSAWPWYLLGRLSPRPSATSPSRRRQESIMT